MLSYGFARFSGHFVNSVDEIFGQITVHVPETRPVQERPQQAARRASNRRTAGQHSRGTRRPAYSTRATAALDVEESAEEEAAATPSDTDEEYDEEEWSEGSR